MCYALSSALSLTVLMAGASLMCRPAQAETTPNTCVNASSDCFRAFDLPGSSGTLHYYTSLDPASGHSPKQALVILHGHPRDANLSFIAGITAARRAGQLDDTLVVAPLFQVHPELAGHCNTPGLPYARAGDATWTCESWLEGGLSSGPYGIGAFAALDAMVAELKRQWPTLDTITIAGFSAGAQMLQRQIAFAGEAPAGLHVRYVVADPGTWLYFDTVRPQLQRNGGAAEWADCGSVASLPGACEVHFVTPADQAACAAGNAWKYGMEQLPPHLQAQGASARKRYIAADIHYLEGELDSSDRKGTFYPILDKSCGAQIQGPYRLQRGVAYAAYDRKYLSTDGYHSLNIIPGCAHNVACVFNADAARDILFPSRTR